MDQDQFVEGLEFDRELSLEELLAACDRTTLDRMLRQLFPSGYVITASSGKVLLGEPGAHLSERTELMLDLEPIGCFASTEAERPQHVIARDCLHLQLRFAQKYLMASALHIEAVQEDFRQLRDEHAALLRSEANYRELCEHLDEKVQAQVRQIEGTQRQLFEAEKQASIGHLAAGMAHEINNPIGFINSNLNTAKSYINDLSGFSRLLREPDVPERLSSFWKQHDLDYVLDDFRELVGDCLSGGQRIAAIVADLKLFSNVDGEESASVCLNPYIEASINMARVSTGRDLNIEFRSDRLPPVHCKPAYIGQVVLALLLNASDASSDPQALIVVTGEANDQRVLLRIADQGVGIPEPLLRKVFDPFFTTRDVGKGKGLGLTYCRDIMRAHQGDIDIASVPGEGTEVTFWLPLRPAQT